MTRALAEAWAAASPVQRSFLRAHFWMPEHCATAQSIALAAGYTDYHDSNRIYGAFAARIGRALGVRPQHWLSTITIAEGTDEQGHTVLQLKPGVVRAIRNLELAARRGQGTYRRNLLKVEKRCRVTGVSDIRFLRASHIKPWVKCEDPERLDGYNGLWLAPHGDALFDEGLITFTDRGDLVIEDAGARRVLAAWHIRLPLNICPFIARQCVYLEFHRREVYGKAKHG
jgi:hypothetical protein